MPEPVIDEKQNFIEEDAPKTIRMEEERLRQAIARQLAEKASRDITDRLRKEERDALPFLSLRPYGIAGDPARQYRRLPVRGQQHPDKSWLIEFQGLGPRMFS